ncbi:hypothetical protein [Endozoicomonas sp. GU-1]|uniref:hypothetical protein n=1 Tax=Endozoicomonas sp. GU-1 TaxID=3009078 RepID=UPI0022B55613|nr:hypothetical protein [Endozoicomonas sp. GU-1]WBA79787.1 hypothetical protein O2T12_15610 [Endozoicomonas sp. GU-1]WBA87368.1 hypothetical protein O3276_04870 [Endozoicomonas sp. GU-1]
MKDSVFSFQSNITSELCPYFKDNTYSLSGVSVQAFSREVVEAATILCSMRINTTNKYALQYPTVIFHKSSDNPTLGKRSIAIINNPANEDQPVVSRLSQVNTLEETISMSYRSIMINDKGCNKARKYQARYEVSDKGKKTRARYEASDKGKKAKSRYEASDKGKETRARYRTSDRGKMATYRARAKYYSSVKGKEKKAIYSAKLMAYKKAISKGFSDKVAREKGKEAANAKQAKLSSLLPHP